jgi:hypothetical protein
MDPASRAIELYKNSKFKSLRAAAKAVDAPKSTVYDRYRGIPSHQESTNKLARLTRLQERVLV